MKLLIILLGVLVLAALTGFTFFALMDIPVEQKEIRTEISTESLSNAS